MAAKGTVHTGTSAAPAILSDYIPEDDLARQIGVCKRTLRRWHALGEGPARTKLGSRVLYRRGSVERWLAARESGSRRAA